MLGGSYMLSWVHLFLGKESIKSHNSQMRPCPAILSVLSALENSSRIACWEGFHCGWRGMQRHGGNGQLNYLEWREVTPDLWKGEYWERERERERGREGERERERERLFLNQGQMSEMHQYSRSSSCNMSQSQNVFNGSCMATESSTYLWVWWQQSSKQGHLILTLETLHQACMRRNYLSSCLYENSTWAVAAFLGLNAFVTESMVLWPGLRELDQ